MRPSILVSLAIILVISIVSSLNATEPKQWQAESLLRDIPTAFEPNSGQAAKEYEFVARRPELSAGFARDFADFMVRGNQSDAAQIRLRFFDGNAASIKGETRLGSKTNYLIGNDPRQWHTGIANYERIRYSHLYPGIDLLFYGKGEKLEHDFIVSPGGDPSRIRFQLQGGAGIKVDRTGDLILETSHGELIFRRPRAYQAGHGGNKNVDASFVLKGSTISFRVGRYDRARALIIDPVIVFSTYLAGGTVEFLNGVAVDASGSVYVTGFTASPDFPTTAASFQPTCPTCLPGSRQGDAFISKLDATGKTLVYSTFIGGSGQDTGSSIRVDANGNALVAGTTTSLDFPALNPINATPPCCNLDLLFVTSLSADGSALNYSGIVGALSFNTDVSLASDTLGDAYIATQTDSTNFPITPGTFSGIPAANPAHTLVVLKVSPAGALLYSTAIPGTAPAVPDAVTDNFIPAAVAVDGSGNAFVAGTAGPGLPTTAGVLAGTLPADAAQIRTAFALKLDPTAANLLYATYIPETDFGHALAIDAVGGAYVGGDTSSTKLPVPINAAVPAPTCTGTSCTFGYVVKLNAAASQQVAGTYMTGTSTTNQFNSVATLALDGSGNVLVAGTTSEATFPVKNPLQSVLRHSTSFSETAFVSELSNDLSTFLFSSFLSGTTGAFPSGVVAGPTGQLIVAGITSDTDFPTTPGSFQSALPVVNTGFIPQHGFIASINVATAAASVCFDKAVLNFGGVLVNTTASQSLNLTNCGNADLHVSSTTVSSPLFAASGCGTAVTPGNSCAIAVSFSPTTTTGANATLTITDDAGLSPQIIPLSGLGGVPQILLPNGVFFGDLAVGTTAATGTVLIVNTGEGALNIAGINVNGDYAIRTNSCGSQVLPGAACGVVLNFSPTAAGARNGALTITDNAQGSPHSVPLSGNGLGQLPLPVITSVPAVAANGAGTLFVLGRNFFPNSTIQWNGSARTTKFVSEFFLSAQLTPADLQVSEGAVTVVNGAPGGGPSNQVLAPVYAQLAVQAQDMVYDAQRNLIYASVGASATANANTIVVIDPASQSVVNSFAVGNNPNKLAISDDDQFLYAGLDATSTVAQIALSSGTVTGTVALGSNFFGGFTAGAIRVLPGLPHSYVVSVIQPKIIPSFDHALVFDDFTARPNQVTEIATGVEAESITFAGTDATKLYAGTIDLFPDSFYRLSVDANGLSFIDETKSIASGALDSDGKFIYVSNGRVIDPTTKTDTAIFQLGGTPSAVKVDAAASRSYFAETTVTGTLGFRPQIEALSDSNGGLIGKIEFQGVGLSPAPTPLLRWGADGLAVLMSAPAVVPQNSVVLLRTSLTSRAAVPGFKISGPGTNGYIPPATIAVGGTATFNLLLSADAGFTGQITLACSALPAGASCSANPATLTVPSAGALTTAVTISTTKQVAAAMPATMHWKGSLSFSAMLLAPLGLVSLGGNIRRRWIAMFCLGMLLLAGAIAGCGGGGSTPPPPPPPQNFTSAGTYNVVLTGTSGTVSRQVNLTVVVQ